MQVVDVQDGEVDSRLTGATERDQEERETSEPDVASECPADPAPGSSTTTHDGACFIDSPYGGRTLS